MNTDLTTAGARVPNSSDAVESNGHSFLRGPHGRSGAIAVSALAVALIAAGLAGWSIMRPTGSQVGASVSERQVTDARARACGASNVVSTAVSLQTHADLGGDPVALQAVAANARLAMAAGGPYLLAHVGPATPSSLAAAVRSFADNLQEIAMYTLAGQQNSDPAQAARLAQAEASSAQIADLCK